jgi:SAM-dependent methyltransferase
VNVVAGEPKKQVPRFARNDHGDALGVELVTFADAKQRFSNRVADYVRYRPSYPPALIDLLRTECGLRSDDVIADVGSGTGLLSKLLLENGNRVFAIEPNEEMRRAGEEYLATHKNFSSVRGSSEATTLPDSSVDFITAAQAFHWFEPAATHREFLRILKPRGWVVVIWNDRRISETAFGRAYEDLLVRYGTDYARVKEAYPETHDMGNFFAFKPGDRPLPELKNRSKDRPLQNASEPAAKESDVVASLQTGAVSSRTNFERRELPNFQDFDFAGLAGRLRSSSYAPKEGDENLAPMMAALRELFDANQKSGRVRMDYTTQIYFGRLDAVRNSG